MCYSEFCVLNALVELKKRGLLAYSLNKMQRFGSTDVSGDEMHSCLKNIKVGEIAAIKGRQDGLWMMKEPDYFKQMIVTSGNLITENLSCSTVRNWVSNGVEILITIFFYVYCR